jgi:signal transduction histidine kinase
VNLSRPKANSPELIEQVTNGTHSMGSLDAVTSAAPEAQAMHGELSDDPIVLKLQVERQARYQALIRRLTMAIQNATELPLVEQMAAEGIAQVLEGDRGMVLRMKYWDPRHSIRSERIPKARVIIDAQWSSEDQSNVIDLSEVRDRQQNPPPASQSFWVVDCGICQYAMTGPSKPLIFHNAQQFTDTLVRPATEILSEQEMPALLMVPLESKGKVLGFLAVQHRVGHDWRIEEVELAELMAAQLSSAIIQTETLRQVESLVEERTAQLQQSLELQAKLYEITRRQIEKLREMNQRMDEFLSTLSHELRTPLTSMMMAIRMLRQASLTPEKQERYLNILEEQCAQETSLVNDLLALQELETKQVAMQVQQVNIQQMVEDLTVSFDQRWGMKGLNLKVQAPEDAIILSTDQSSVQRILLELMTNAGKYSDPSTAIELKLKPLANRSVEVTITNIGAGIPAEELPQIFEKFRRAQGMTQQAVPGTGLGLALVKSLVQHLNGTIEAISEPMEGSPAYLTTFIVTLPLNLETAKG